MNLDSINQPASEISGMRTAMEIKKAYVRFESFAPRNVSMPGLPCCGMCGGSTQIGELVSPVHTLDATCIELN